MQHVNILHVVLPRLGKAYSNNFLTKCCSRMCMVSSDAEEHLKVLLVLQALLTATLPWRTRKGNCNLPATDRRSSAAPCLDFTCRLLAGCLPIQHSPNVSPGCTWHQTLLGRINPALQLIHKKSTTVSCFKLCFNVLCMDCKAGLTAA